MREREGVRRGWRRGKTDQGKERNFNFKLRWKVHKQVDLRALQLLISHGEKFEENEFICKFVVGSNSFGHPPTRILYTTYASSFIATQETITIMHFLLALNGATNSFRRKYVINEQNNLCPLIDNQLQFLKISWFFWNLNSKETLPHSCYYLFR